MNRTSMREQAFRLIYSLEIQKQEPIENQIELFIENNNIENEDAKEYISDAVLGIDENK